MKAIVAEIDKKQMIVITDKGDFVKVRRQLSVGIGDEIELKPQKLSLTYRRLASIAACFLACIFLSTGVYAYYTPYSYVSVDINPSIALSLNRFERVISVNPLNEDAVSLVRDTKNLKNQEIDDALSEIIKSASEKGYIEEKDENQVMVVVSAKDPRQEAELAEVVTTAAANELSKYGVMVEKASIESYKAAISNKMSPGKELLADKLREVNPGIKDEDVRNMSVKEVVHLIKEGRKTETAKDPDNTEKDKAKDKEKDAINSKDGEKQDGKGTAKAAAEDKGNKKNDDKAKPGAAASNKGNEEIKEKDKEVKAAAEEKTAGKDDKEDKNDKNGDEKKKEIEDKDKQNNGSGGQGNKDEKGSSGDKANDGGKNEKDDHESSGKEKGNEKKDN